MSDKEIQEEVNNDDATEATETPSNPASELVDLVLSGELHAANEKFHGIVESKVVSAIEDEKLKIAQTLFAEEDEEPLEEAPKSKVKEDDDDSDDEDDDEEEDSGKDKPAPPSDKEDDDDDSDSDDDDDSGDEDKPKKGKVPPQFMKKEGVTGDDDANEKALAKNREMAKKYGQVRQGIPADKKEGVEPVDELSAKTADSAAQKAYNDIRDNPSSQKPTLGTTKTAKHDAKRKRQADKFDAYRDSKDFDKKGSKKGGAAKAAGKMGKKSDQQRHTDWRDNPDDQNYGHYVSNSFDPGEASSNVELPEGSFVAQVASYLSGNRK